MDLEVWFRNDADYINLLSSDLILLTCYDIWIYKELLALLLT